MGILDQIGGGIGGLLSQLSPSSGTQSVDPPSAPLTATSPDVGNRLLTSFTNFANAGGLLPALAGGLTGLVTGQSTDPGVRRQQLFAQAMQQGPAGSTGGSSTPGAGPDLSRLQSALLASGDLEGAKNVAEIGAKSQTELIKNYLFARQNGFTGTPFQYEAAIKKAGATNVNQNVQTGEKAYDQAWGKILAEANSDLIKGASTARTNLANLDRLEQALSDPKVYQGAGAETVLKLRKLAGSVGIPVDGVADAEVAQSISNQLALNARNPAGGAGMPGSLSDSDRVYLREMQPGIDKTPAGNKRMIDVNRKLNQRSIDVENLRQQYVRKKGRLDEGFYREVADFANANPLFSGSPPAPTANTPAPTNVRKFNPASGRIE